MSASLELSLAGCGRRLLDLLCCSELHALHTAARSIEIPEDVLLAASWASDPGRWIGTLKEMPAFGVDRAVHCFHRWRRAVLQSSWTTDSGPLKREDASLCCWPALRRLVLKPQHVNVRLPGAPHLLDLLADGGSDFLCLALDSRTHRYVSEDPLGELSVQILLVGTSLTAGGLIVLQHRLMTLDFCRGSPDSPGGLEHVTQVLLAPGEDALVAYLLAEDPYLLQELTSTLALPLAEFGIPPQQKDRRLLIDPDNWISILNAEPIFEVRLQMFQKLASVLVQASFCTILVFVVECYRHPDIFAASWLLLATLTYCIYSVVLAGFLPITSSMLQHLYATLNCILLAALPSVWLARNDHLAGFGMVQGAQILLGVVFAPSKITVMFSAFYPLVTVWATIAIHGFEALTLLFLFQQAFQAVISIVLPAFVEASLRERIVASLRSKDSDSLIFGFRQMLKGICDGELLLDSDRRVCGNAACLQRLLTTQEDYVGRSFHELIDGHEATEKFEKFLATALEVITENRESAPRCLRVPLRAPSGRIISVDVCHVPLPQLYGSKSMHHLLSLTEDSDGREAPEEAEPVDMEHLSGNLPRTAGRSSPASVASDETLVECHDELEEITLVLNASTELIDIEEAHLRFVRHSNEATFGMGMPTLKRFARPLDWHGMEAFIHHYARQVVKGTAKNQTLKGLKLRIPGESRKHLKARSAVVSSPFERKSPDEPVHLFLHMMGFEGERGRRPGQHLQGVDEDSSGVDAEATLGRAEDALPPVRVRSDSSSTSESQLPSLEDLGASLPGTPQMGAVGSAPDSYECVSRPG